MSQLLFPGMPPKPRADLSQWFTDKRLADAIVTWALRLGHRRILEPSAGDGAFVEPLVRLAGAERVTAVEIDPPWAQRLRQIPKLTVTAEDFLQYQPPHRFDLTVMNPPYEDDQDLTHVVHALSMADEVVALVRLNFLSGVARHKQIWSKHTLTGLRLFTNRPRFSGAGSPRHDFCVVKVCAVKIQTARHAGSVDVGWWTNRGEAMTEVDEPAAAWEGAVHVCG